MRLPVVIAALAFAACNLLGAERTTLSGKVTDNSGRPVGHATVLVYHAGVKHGYSTFCPSCYADCGKRVITGPDGTFVIKDLDSDLWFDILAVADGFEPAFVKKVDPASQPAPTATLLPRPIANTPDKVVRGRVVTAQGRPLRDAVVEPLGMSGRQLVDSAPANEEVSVYGEIKGLEPMAITNENGEFEIATQKSASGMLLKIDARGFAPKLQAVSTGLDRKTVTVLQGAVIRGRLVAHGAGVAGAEIGLSPRGQGGFGGNLKIYGSPYEEIRVGTQADGSFVLADIPAPVDWYLYAKMTSLSQGASTQPVECATKQAGDAVDIGDLHLEAGHSLKGKILLPDGKSMPDGMRVIISSSESRDSQVVPLHSDGSFECSGLPTGTYDIYPAVRGYVASKPIRKMPIEHDISDLKIMLRPK
jgi:hypothetical protein